MTTTIGRGYHHSDGSPGFARENLYGCFEGNAEMMVNFSGTPTLMSTTKERKVYFRSRAGKCFCKEPLIPQVARDCTESNGLFRTFFPSAGPKI